MTSTDLPTVHAWTSPDISDLECFRANGLAHEYGRHFHSTWSIGIVDRGYAGMWYRGANRRGAYGDLFAIAPGEVHTGYPVHESGLTYSILYVGDALLRDILPDADVSPSCAPFPIRDQQLALQLRRVCRALESERSDLTLDSELLTVLGCFFTRHGRISEGAPAGREPLHVQRIKEYLQANLASKVRLQQLADLTGLSKAYVIRSFTHLVGMPPHEWLLQMRIEVARKRLQQGCDISDLAADLGFADQSHFHRRFKRLTGVTPALYAKGHFRSRRSGRITGTLPGCVELYSPS
jgi:AraC-like DNA-binding protein